MSAAAYGQQADQHAPYYYVPAASAHPVRASASMLLTLFGAAFWINGSDVGRWMFIAGLACFLLATPSVNPKRA